MFKIGSIFIPVTNIEKAADWYEKYLGAQKINSWDNGAGFYLAAGSTQLALIKAESEQPVAFITEGRQKNAYYNFVVDDIEAAHHHFQSHNVETTEINNFGGMKCFDFFDLDGNPFSVVNEAEDSPFHSDNVRKMQRNGK
ncbi:VOC family protein [Oceanobacillus sp. FSL W7-1281]|uniref:VOC family protein n=1 Tax=Oceanobacillus sp. FSL W7-1281 TaxID=2921698 RepID=UPI0030DB4D33